MEIKKIYVFALAATGLGISGGDRIFIEFARRWAKFCPIKIYIWQEGYEMCQRQNLNKLDINYYVSSMEPWRKFGFAINYLARIIEGIRLGFSLKMTNPENVIIYSASEFWMDCLPALLVKLRYPNVGWVAAWYQTAPMLLKGFSEENKQRISFNSLLYWLVQLLIKPLISKFADFVLVNNEEEKKQFPRHNKMNKAIVVLGAVDLDRIKEFKKLYPKKYDAVFQGRFHPQKGVEELVDIWEQVTAHKPEAKLVMIGDGPLMDRVKLKIKNKRLENHIILTGYLFDGEEKYRIFSQSKLVIHPAFYDSGGMASAEAMAFGLPAVGFDLKSFRSYYPQGMIKVKIGDISSFAKCIVELLNDMKKRVKLGKEAQKMIKKGWSWDERAKKVLSEINKNYE